MRTGPGGVAWFTVAEMSWDLDFRSIAKLKPYVDDLVNAGWLMCKPSRGQDYYIVPDPFDVLVRLHKAGKLPGERVDEIDDLAELLGQETLTDRAAGVAPSPGKRKKKLNLTDFVDDGKTKEGSSVVDDGFDN
jgi:hypothetical protein